VLLVGWLLGACLLGCGASGGAQHADDVGSFRKHAQASREPDVVAKWLLLELLSPGGRSQSAVSARERLDDQRSDGLYPSLARGLDDDLHGRLRTAPDHYLAAARAARTSDLADADVLAQFAVKRALSLRSNTQRLWRRWRSWVTEAIGTPERLGWRTRDELVQWWLEEAWSKAAQDVEAHAVARLGCFEQVRLAGPFGMGARSDTQRRFDAEELGSWPLRFAANPHFGTVPRVLETERTGCTVEVGEPVSDGVFYAEAAFETKDDTTAILAVANAARVWVDGVLVLDRDLREWGSWTKVAAGLDLPRGQHRIVARLFKAQTSVRLLRRDGLPLAVTELDPKSGVVPGEAARASFEPSPLRRYLGADGVTESMAPWLRHAASDLAHHDGENDVAALLLEPLVQDPKTATGPALGTAALVVRDDPLFDANKTEDMMRDLHERAVAKDPALWQSELHVVGQLAKSRGITEALPAFERLTERYREVPSLLGSLAAAYAELGWTPEYVNTVELRAERFPEDTDGLYAAAQVLAQEGKRAESERLFQRIKQLDPDSEVWVGLALERREYDRALAELSRLHSRRPQRDELVRRMEEVKVYSGQGSQLLPLLEKRVDDSPRDAALRLELADARYALGDTDALRVGIVDSVLAGANPEPLKQAVDLVEGTTELESFRLNGQDVIREYERSGQELSGTAARVLDYMAAWVRADGSSRLLEHEIVRIQSEEAIGRFAEHAVEGDVVLQMRVIKKDGRILEPEPVAGKPTVTFPHLEIGDYIETEQIYAREGSVNGALYDGPHWFFQEQGVAYARSEFVVIAPVHQPLTIETTGPVPTPTVEERGYFRVHRWRVDMSPPAVTEPMSVPISEYLPSVQISWGIDREKRLRLLGAQVTESTPVDPRIVRIAKKIGASVPANRHVERAKHLYHWVLDNVEPGEEEDGRRVVTGKRGSQWRAFETLCRALDIPVSWAVAKNRLAPAPKGPAMDARQYNHMIMRVGTTRPAWLAFEGKFVPFGYVPAGIRGMPAYLLTAEGAEEITLPSAGTEDGVAFDVEARLAPDGSAELRLTQRYMGEFASSLRQALSEIAESRLHDLLEERLLSSAFPGARLLEYEVVHQGDPDVPLSIVMVAEMSNFARAEGKRLVLSPPYATRLTQLAALPSRETALLVAAERRQSVDMKIQLPAGARALVQAPARLRFEDFSVEVSDRFEGATLHLRRSVAIPPTRVAPETYGEFQRFTREADAAITRDVVIEL
jgi:tetratricopeptide (TPR) repeat protein